MLISGHVCTRVLGLNDPPPPTHAHTPELIWSLSLCSVKVTAGSAQGDSCSVSVSLLQDGKHPQASSGDELI